MTRDPAAWQADDLRVECWQGSDQPVETLSDGLLVAAVGGEASGQFVLVSDAGDLVLETVVFTVVLPHDILEPLARSRAVLGGLGVPAIGDGAHAAPLVELVAGADIRLHELGSDSRVLTWWTPDDKLQYVEVTDAGPVLPVATLSPSGRASRPDGVMNRALKEVAARHDR